MLNQQWTRGAIERKIRENDLWMVRALLALSKRSGGDGFNAVDGPRLRRMAFWWQTNGYLSSTQKEFVRARIVKYSGQLVQIANRPE